MPESRRDSPIRDPGTTRVRLGPRCLGPPHGRLFAPMQRTTRANSVRNSINLHFRRSTPMAWRDRESMATLLPASSRRIKARSGRSFTPSGRRVRRTAVFYACGVWTGHTIAADLGGRPANLQELTRRLELMPLRDREMDSVSPSSVDRFRRATDGRRKLATRCFPVRSGSSRQAAVRTGV